MRPTCKTHCTTYLPCVYCERAAHAAKQSHRFVQVGGTPQDPKHDVSTACAVCGRKHKHVKKVVTTDEQGVAVAEITIRPDYYKALLRLRNHDNEERTVECQDVIDGLDLGYNKGNALKYLWRAGHKTEDAREDLRKVLTYVQFELARLEAK